MAAALSEAALALHRCHLRELALIQPAAIPLEVIPQEMKGPTAVRRRGEKMECSRKGTELV
jgi:hypothetical protein